MGVAVSKTLISNVVSTYMSFITNIVQESGTNLEGNNFISVFQTGGDVIIRGNKVLGTYKIDSRAFFNSFNDVESRQKLAIELQASAKSILKDLNLFQFADSETVVNTIVQSALSVATNISIACNATLIANQGIYIETTKGSVIIENNISSQIANIFQNCVSNVINQNKALQEIDAKIDAASSASASGINPLYIAIIAVCIVVGEVTLASKIALILPIIGVALMALGGLFFYLWSKSKTVTMSSTLYSKTMKKMCSAVPYKTSTSNLRAADAEAICEEDSACAAYDFVAYDQNGAPVSPFASYYYKDNVLKIPSCMLALTEQDKFDFEMPHVYAEKSANDSTPSPTSNSIYLDNNSGFWYISDGIKWIIGGKFTGTAPFRFNRNPQPIQGQATIITAQDTWDSPYIWEVEEKNGTITTVSGPGPRKANLDAINASGKKITASNKSWLWAAIASIVTGLITLVLGIYMLITQKAKNKSTNKDESESSTSNNLSMRLGSKTSRF